MTSELRDVLTRLLADDGNEYSLLTVEYPADERGAMKTVCRMTESDLHHVDIYRADGTTEETSRFYSRREGVMS